MGRFAVGGSAGFALGPLIAGGVYVFGAHFLWVFTAIALLGVLLYLYAFTGEADTTNAGESKSSAHLLIWVRMIGRALVSYSL